MKILLFASIAVFCAAVDEKDFSKPQRSMVRDGSHFSIQSKLDKSVKPKTGTRNKAVHRVLQDYDTINDFPCYRSLDGIRQQLFSDLQAYASSIPNLSVDVQRIGESYEGRGMTVLVITGDGVEAAGRTTEKGIIFVQGAIHAREYTPPEVLSRWAERLVYSYGKDADITALVDHTEFHILTHANPDGRVIAETNRDAYQRKNRNPINDDCGDEAGNRPGVDLNRNFPFFWGRFNAMNHPNGGSDNICSSTYRGVNPQSELETQVIMDYARGLFPPGQRRTNPEDQVDEPITEDATGIFFDMHSFGALIVWPYNHEGDANTVTKVSPNKVGFESIALKLQLRTDYKLSGPPQDNTDLYAVSGSSSDWAYGELGVAGMAFEIGLPLSVGIFAGFYEACNHFLSVTLPKNIDALMYSAKLSRRPFFTSNGPDVIDIDFDFDIIFTSRRLTLRAVVSDNVAGSLFSAFQQDVEEICVFIDAHPYDFPAPMCHQMTLTGSGSTVTGTFSETIEALNLSAGKHILYIEGKDSGGYKGPVTAKSFQVIDLPSSPVDIYFLVDTSGSFIDDIEDFKQEARSIIEDIRAENRRFGLGTFQDYPIPNPNPPPPEVDVGVYGIPTDVAYKRLQQITAEIDDVLDKIENDLTISGMNSGGDFPESQLTALYQSVRGEEQTVTYNDPGTGEEKTYVIPGGQEAGFDPDAAKIIILWTDSTFHRAEFDENYPGKTTDETLAALADGGIEQPPGTRRLQLPGPLSSVAVVGVSRGDDQRVLADLREIAAATGAVAGAGGVDCDGNDTIDILQGEPIVCPGVTGSGAAIATAINNVLVSVFETLIPVEANCRQNVEIVATSSCSAAITIDDINNGSNGYNIELLTDAEEPLGLGEHEVTLTVIDGYGEMDTCTSLVTVVDTYILFEDVSCGLLNGGDWETITPPDVSDENPMRATASVTKTNGCPATITHVSAPLCERCNGANQVITPACSNIQPDGDTMVVPATIGVGSFISWSVKASGSFHGSDEITIHCGLCVEAPNRKRFTCPSEKPSRIEADAPLVWPSSSLSDIDACPFSG